MKIEGKDKVWLVVDPTSGAMCMNNILIAAQFSRLGPYLSPTVEVLYRDQRVVDAGIYQNVTLFTDRAEAEVEAARRLATLK